MRIITTISMRNISKKKVLYYILVIVILLVLLHPDFNARHSYTFIKRDEVWIQLHFETAQNFSSTANVYCDYSDIINDESTLPVGLIDGDLTEGHQIKEGGEYAPSHCRPKFSVAIIVPYRDRAELLRGFLVYMHTFLRRQKVHYRIYVVEQVDSRPFNRAKLLNVGAVAALRAGYPCVILHDVDLLPLKLANLYACTKCPRHMSSGISKFRFVLPHITLFGGAIAIMSRQFRSVNGMSNEYFGSAVGEDDDLYARLEACSLKPCRFDPDTSTYHMATQKSQIKGYREKNQKMLDITKSRMASDGLNTLQYTEVATVLHPLFTHIMVDF